MTIYNFAAGPAVLPKSVIKQVQAELPDFQNSGMSILEISHRSKLFTDLYEDTKTRLLKLMNLGDDYDALFLQGGASLQFTMVPLNLATNHHRVAYIDTGHWAVRAIQEAQKIPNLQVDTLASSKTIHYTDLPKMPDVLQNTYDYLHITANNTIEGTAYRQLPQSDTTLVGDLSSNFLAQNYDFSQFGLIYAGAQKNLAPAGLTVVVLKKRLIQPNDALPSMLDYRTQADKDSAFNTPPVFQIYVADLVLRWLETQGGVSGITKTNQQKAQTLYDFLDQSQLFKNPVAPKTRSLTNIPFMTNDKAEDAKVVAAATAAGLLNLKGHRSVGGLRASLYNAMPQAGVDALVAFLKDYEVNHK